MQWEEAATFQLLNKWCYVYKRNSWMLDLSRYWRDFQDVVIDRPIFLLGTQGGGLTLVSRMLRRHEQIVSVTGDHEYWAGADEMQNVYWPILPETLTGLRYHVPRDETFRTPRGWVYATEHLLPAYRNTRDHVTAGEREQFRRLLRWTIKRHAKGKTAVRFTDKSQLYTVKVSYLNGLLEDCDPKFLLITRNPYAMCYRSTDGTRSLRMLQGTYDFNQRLELAAQHWANSVACAQEDGKRVKSFMVVRFEDVLRNPEQELRKICEFVELDFSDDLLPHADHKVPFGSMRRNRWYPLKPEINARHLQAMSGEHVEIVARWCGTYADMLGYEKPDKVAVC